MFWWIDTVTFVILSVIILFVIFILGGNNR